MFTRELIAYIVQQTNLYALECLGEGKWTEVTVVIYAFDGLVPLPSMTDYWSNDLIANKISRDRFLDILRYLHFVDNRTLPKQGQPGYTKLGKIQPIIDSAFSGGVHSWSRSQHR